MKMSYRREYRPTCSPEPDGNEYEGWHRKTLVKYDREEAEDLAEKYEMSYFYCEYGNCYHLCH